MADVVDTDELMPREIRDSCAMMRRPEHGPPLLLAALFVLLAGCGGRAGVSTDPLADSPGARPFSQESDGRWIGNAVCYGPHRDGQRPGGPSPSMAELREDLQLMLPQWKLLRIYGSTEIAESLLRVIREDGLVMKVVLGAWIAPDTPADNRREVDEAVRLANAFPDIVVAVSVGNETQVYWTAHRCSPDVLIESIRRARAAVAVPVTTADDYNFWNKPESREVAAEIDFIMMHAHPMWNGVQLEDALGWLRTQMETIQAMHPGRAVVIGETGWATAVHDEGEQAELIKGRPGEIEQKLYYDAVRDWAQRVRQPLFFFEAFDENWKGGPHPAEVEKHWGVFRADRSAKEAVGSHRDN